MARHYIQDEENFSRRFWSKVQKGDGCWVWIGARNKAGYGNFWLNGFYLNAHVASWIFHFGPVAGGLFVLHQCDNPSCVRPDHLFTGTSQDNTQDMMRKGRHSYTLPPIRFGTNNPASKLTEDEVCEIRRLYVPGVISQTEVGKRFSVTQGIVGQIIRRERWAHI